VEVVLRVAKENATPPSRRPLAAAALRALRRMLQEWRDDDAPATAALVAVPILVAGTTTGAAHSVPADAPSACDAMRVLTALLQSGGEDREHSTDEHRLAAFTLPLALERGLESGMGDQPQLAAAELAAVLLDRSAVGAATSAWATAAGVPSMLWTAIRLTALGAGDGSSGSSHPGALVSEALAAALRGLGDATATDAPLWAALQTAAAAELRGVSVGALEAQSADSGLAQWVVVLAAALHPSAALHVRQASLHFVRSLLVRPSPGIPQPPRTLRTALQRVEWSGAEWSGVPNLLR